jgi:hypothetical protein
LSLMRAFLVVNCPIGFVWLALRSCSLPAPALSSASACRRDLPAKFRRGGHQLIFETCPYLPSRRRHRTRSDSRSSTPLRQVGRARAVDDRLCFQRADVEVSRGILCPAVFCPTVASAPRSSTKLVGLEESALPPQKKAQAKLCTLGVWGRAAVWRKRCFDRRSFGSR